jgi:hypothetical protein
MIFKLTNVNYKTFLNKPLLFSMCRNMWLGTTDNVRRTILYRILVKNYIVRFPISNMIIESCYDKQDNMYWEISHLNAARTGYVPFLKMTILSQRSA